MRQKLALPVLAAVGLLYVYCLPHTVQGLDTGELVADAYLLRVPHPPGYPAFVLLHYAFIHAIPFGSVFFRAALCSSLCALATLFLLLKLAEDKVVNVVAFVLPLALCMPFWQYAELPDVFSLNGLLVTFIACSYLQEKPARWMLVAFAIGLANHQTIIFTLPMLLHAFYKERDVRAACVAVLLLVGLYGSLLWMHADDLLSWGHLQTLDDLARHFLRSDYGTFQLNASGLEIRRSRNYTQLAVALLTCVPVAIFAIVGSVRGFSNTRWRVCLACFVAYCLIFFGVANIVTYSVFVRFAHMAVVWATVLAINRVKYFPRLLVCGGTAVAVFSLMQNLTEANYSQETIVEDYAHNVLAMTSRSEHSVVLARGDTRLNAIRYVQSVLGDHPSVRVALAEGTPSAWKQKFLRSNPDFHFAPGGSDFFSTVVAPNLSQYEFILAGPPDSQAKGFKSTILPVGRRLSAGQGHELGEDWRDRLRFRSTPARYTPSLQPLGLKEIYAEYALYPLRAGQFDEALQRVPYCFPAIYAQCLKTPGKREDDCQAKVQEVMLGEANYF